MVAAIAKSVVVATTALAQMPTSPWKKGAPFPEADEELYGVTTNGKLYVFGGWDGGKARGVAYEYDPATESGPRRRRCRGRPTMRPWPLRTARFM